MKFLCPYCPTETLYTLDQGPPHILAKCSGCGGDIKFARIKSITNYLVTRKRIWALTQDVALISEVKQQMNWTDRMWPVQRDIAYHNLFVNITLKLELKTLERS